MALTGFPRIFSTEPLAPSGPRKALEGGEEYDGRARRQLAIVLFIGAAAAVASIALSCDAVRQCVDENTCLETSDVCGFSNRVSTLADAAYDANVSADALAELLRGPCAPGERHQHDASGKVSCVTFFGYPDALDFEIMDDSAAEPHLKACGKWVEAGGAPRLDGVVETRAWSEHEAWVAALKAAEDAATASPRASSSPEARFRAECTRTAHAGAAAVRAAAVLAYDELNEPIDQASDRLGIVRAVGHLAGRLCEAPVQLGIYLVEEGRFEIDIYGGWRWKAGVLAEALQLVGEPASVQREAEDVNGAVDGVYGAPALTNAEIVELLKGATGEANIPSHGMPTFTSATLLEAILQHMETSSIDHVRSYLKGVSAYCVWSLRSAIDPVGEYVKDERARIQRSRPPAAALGRLATNLSNPTVTKETVDAASSITVSQLSSGATGDASVDCLALMRALFPDRLDAARFNAAVAPALYERLSPLVRDMRVGVGLAVLSSPISDILSNPNRVSSDVALATYRFAGAPRGSWAGIARPFPHLNFDDESGVFKNALKQSSALFNDRVVGLVFNQADACDHPPFFDALELNAYIMPSLRCVVHFLGMSTRPFFDAAYDEKSLASRGGMVVAHELAHLTLNVNYDTFLLQQLLHRYVESTFDEAFADVIAALGVEQTGMAEREYVLTSYCQLWCSRMPFGWTGSQTASHPQYNDRCNFLYKTIYDITR